MNENFDEISDKYIHRQWRKDVISLNYQLYRDHFDEEDANVTKLVNEIFFNIESALDIVRYNKHKLASLAKKHSFG